MNRALVPVLAALGLLLAGCSSAGSDRSAPPVAATGSGRSGSTATGSDGQPADLAFGGVVDGAAHGADDPDGVAGSAAEAGSRSFADAAGGAVPGVLRLALSRPSSLRPDKVSLASQEAVIAVDLLYDGLTEVNAAGALAPGLALVWWADSDFNRWSFRLDPGRSDLTAEAVAAQFQARLGPDASPLVAGLLAGVSSVGAVSEFVVEIVLDRPQAALPWLLTSPALGLVGEGDGPTGRYRIYHQDGDGMALVARSGGGSAPGRIEIQWAASAEDAYRSLTLGRVDAAVAPAASMADAGDRFGADPAPRAISRYYGMNVGSPILADERVRRAVLLAVDRDEIARQVSLAPAVAADGLVAPGLAGYQPGACGQDCRHDPAAAAALVAEVEAETGMPLVVGIAYGGEDHRLTARALADDLRAVGVESQLLQQSTEQLAGTIDTNVGDLFAFGWVAGAASIDAVVPLLLRSDSPANGLGVHVEEVDQLIGQAARTGDDEARWALLRAAQDAALSRYQVLPLAVASSYLVTAPQASGLATGPDGSIRIPAPE